MHHHSKKNKSDWSLPSLNAPVSIQSAAVIRFCEYLKSEPNLSDLAKNQRELDRRLFVKADMQTRLVLEKALKDYLKNSLSKFSQQVTEFSDKQKSECFGFAYNLSKRMPELKNYAYPLLHKILDQDISVNSKYLVNQFLRKSLPIELKYRAEQRLVEFFALNPDIRIISSGQFNFLDYIEKDTVSSRLLISAFESYFLRNAEKISTSLVNSDKQQKNLILQLLIEVCLLTNQNQQIFADFLYDHRRLLIKQYNNPENEHDILWMAKAVSAVMSCSDSWYAEDKKLIIEPWNKFCDQLRKNILDYQGQANHAALKIAQSFLEGEYNTATFTGIASLMSFLVFGKDRVDLNTFAASAVQRFNYFWIKSSQNNDPISWITKNVKCMIELEQSRQGSLLELYSDYNILNFARYGTQNLLKQLENTTFDRKTIFFISTYDDWNGAFSERQDLIEYLSDRAGQNDRQLIIAEVGFVEDLLELIPKFCMNEKRYIYAVIFNDHFSPGYSTLRSRRSNNYTISYTQLKPELYMGSIFQRIAECMLENAQVSLIGCRTADDNYSLACALSELLPDIYVEGMRFNDNASYIEFNDDRYLQTISAYYNSARAIRWYQAGYVIEE